MDMAEHGPGGGRSTGVRVFAAFAVALAFALGVYALLSATRPPGGLVSFSFLLILPAAISAFVAWIADPWGTRPRNFYLMIPVWIGVAVVAASLLILKEGVICVLILSPLWLGSGLLGAWGTWRLRRRSEDLSSVFSAAFLLLPLAAMQVEPFVPLPQRTFTVTRTIEVAATPARLWPLMRGIPDVQPGEGCWNISQDVIGVPRPLGARLVGAGVGAQRMANWGARVRFREVITRWAPGRAIGWRFMFDNLAGWAFTDRHLMPDSPYFRVLDGGYRVIPLASGRTRLVLATRYRVRTPVNAYAALWGELFLGDLENNLLALVKNRAERSQSIGAMRNTSVRTPL